MNEHGTTAYHTVLCIRRARYIALGCQTPGMWRRLTAAFSAAVVLGSWAICALSYASRGGGAYNGGLFALFILVAAVLTIWAAALVVQAWLGTVSVLAAAPVSALAAASILWLALAIGLRG